MAKKRQYSKENIEKAVQHVLNGGFVNEAAKLFCVPRSTIQFKLKHPDTKFKSGPDPVLSVEEEKSISEWVIQLARQGFPRKKDDIKSCIEAFLKDNPRPNPFKDNRPGNCWFKAFLKRNPDITSRTSEGVTSASFCVAEKDIRKWFQEITAYFEEKGILHVLDDPSRIYNADETSFNICPKTGKVLAEKGMKNVYEIEKSSCKENITVMFGFSASGKTLNPLIVYPYKRIPEKICATLPLSWGVARSDKGWMTAQVFYEYISNIFYPQLVTDQISFPVVLFVDGHKTHLSREVTQLCVEQGIHLIALYPNATRILQPADVAAFKPLKTAWQKGLRQWYANNNYSIALNKQSFGPLLHKVVCECISKDTLVNGFRVTGLCPFNPDNVDYSKCLANCDNNITAPADGVTNRCDSVSSWKMDYETFVKIVGDDVVRKFIQGDVENTEMRLLYKLWQKFMDPQDEFESLKHIGDQKNNPHESKSSDELPSERPADNSETESSQDLVLDPKTGVLRAEHSTKSSENDFAPPVSPEQVKTVAEQYDVDNNLNNQPSTSGRDPNKTITVLSNIPLSEFLKTKFWPETPKRKGKKCIPKMPVAITSGAYIEMVNTKHELKEKTEAEKENRKRKRAELKESKIKKTKVTKTKKIKKKCDKKSEVEDLENLLRVPLQPNYFICDSCKGEIRKIGVVCCECGANFHVDCVPFKHRIHIPTELEDDFVCHKCFNLRVESDSSLDDFVDMVSEQII